MVDLESYYHTLTGLSSNHTTIKHPISGTNTYELQKNALYYDNISSDSRELLVTELNLDATYLFHLLTEAVLSAK